VSAPPVAPTTTRRRLLDRAMDVLLRLSSRWWLVAGLVAMNLAAFQVLFALEAQFEAVSGRPTLDTQNELTAGALREQLPLYSGPAADAYMEFAAFDFVFPLVAGLTVAVLGTVLLRPNPSPRATSAIQLRLPLLLLLGTGFDYLENLAFLALLAGDPGTPSDVLVALALTAKAAKLTMLAVSGAALVALTGWLVAARLTARRTGPRTVT
jgi:hypothetical protein